MGTALIIEDDKELGEIFADILLMDGWEAELVHDGRKALEILTVKVPDVIILDMHMPHMSGPEVLTCIRADERLDNTRVMIVTADAFVGKMMEAEVDIVVVKPISMDQLMGLTKQLLTVQPRPRRH